MHEPFGALQVCFLDAGDHSMPGGGSLFGVVRCWGCCGCWSCQGSLGACRSSLNLPTRGRQRLAVSAPMLSGCCRVPATTPGLHRAIPVPHRTCTPPEPRHRVQGSCLDEKAKGGWLGLVHGPLLRVGRAEGHHQHGLWLGHTASSACFLPCTPWCHARRDAVHAVMPYMP